MATSSDLVGVKIIGGIGSLLLVLAAAAVGELVAAGLAANPHSSTAESDPNRLLGRPNGYASRTRFTIPGVDASGSGGDVEGCDRGGCVERWSDEEAGQARVADISEIGRRLPAAVEYSYVREDGLVLRIANAATPTEAERVSAVFLAGETLVAMAGAGG